MKDKYLDSLTSSTTEKDETISDAIPTSPSSSAIQESYLHLKDKYLDSLTSSTTEKDETISDAIPTSPSSSAIQESYLHLKDKYLDSLTSSTTEKDETISDAIPTSPSSSAIQESYLHFKDKYLESLINSPNGNDETLSNLTSYNTSDSNAATSLLPNLFINSTSSNTSTSYVSFQEELTAALADSSESSEIFSYLYLKDKYLAESKNNSDRFENSTIQNNSNRTDSQNNTIIYVDQEMSNEEILSSDEIGLKKSPVDVLLWDLPTSDISSEKFINQFPKKSISRIPSPTIIRSSEKNSYNDKDSSYIPLDQNFGSLLNNVDTITSKEGDIDIEESSNIVSLPLSYLPLKDRISSGTEQNHFFLTSIDNIDSEDSFYQQEISKPNNTVSYLYLKDRYKSTTHKPELIFVGESNPNLGPRNKSTIIKLKQKHADATALPPSLNSKNDENKSEGSVFHENPLPNYSNENLFDPNYDILQKLSSIVKDVQNDIEDSNSLDNTTGTFVSSSTYDPPQFWNTATQYLNSLKPTTSSPHQAMFVSSHETEFDFSHDATKNNNKFPQEDIEQVLAQLDNGFQTSDFPVRSQQISDAASESGLSSKTKTSVVYRAATPPIRSFDHDRECLDPTVRYGCATCGTMLICIGTQAFLYECNHPKVIIF